MKCALQPLILEIEPRTVTRKELVCSKSVVTFCMSLNVCDCNQAILPAPSLMY